jgi:hypothetical protein
MEITNSSFSRPKPHLTAWHSGYSRNIFSAYHSFPQKDAECIYSEDKTFRGYNINVREEYYPSTLLTSTSAGSGRKQLPQHDGNSLLPFVWCTPRTRQSNTIDSILNLYPSKKESFDKQFILGKYGTPIPLRTRFCRRKRTLSSLSRQGGYGRENVMYGSTGPLFQH